jgi:2-polyprenyl-3-methyl-5-hydroxy-6-metoxy-1,4-benzoquinol methylase
MDYKSHWENIHSTKSNTDVSWYQATPVTSIDFIESLGVPKDAAIIDIGGGDSFLVDHLLALGYTNVTVLDISAAAIAKAKERVGDKSKQVKWVVSDINEFDSTENYDVWHDRAAFHFLTRDEEISKYVRTVYNGLNPFGTLILGTFSENGPTKCSGIEITQYSQESMVQLFSESFVKIECTNVDHTTPFDTVQNFTFCRFKRKS